MADKDKPAAKTNETPAAATAEGDAAAEVPAKLAKAAVATLKPDRTLLAGSALQGLLAGGEYRIALTRLGNEDAAVEAIVKLAEKFADAQLAELKTKD